MGEGGADSYRPPSQARPDKRSFDVAKPNPERRITIGDKSLLIPHSVDQEMDALNQFVAEREIVAETFGWGLTQKVDDNTERVVEFMSPNPDKVFVVKSLFLAPDQSKLMDILASANSLTMKVIGNEVVIVPDNKTDSDTWLRFSAQPGKEINWGIAKAEVEDLVGFKLPVNTAGVSAEIQKRNQASEAKSAETELQLKTGWEMVIAGGGAIITHNFIDRIQSRAKETNTDIHFTMHHHPNLGLAVSAMADKGYREREQYYQTLLQFSSADLKSMVDAGVDFFEIRALGTPQNPASRTDTTNRVYRAQEVLADSKPLEGEIKGVLEGALQTDNPKTLGELGQDIYLTVLQLQAKGYPVNQLIEYYIGADKYRNLKRQIRDNRLLRNGKDFLMYQLLQFEGDKPFPNISEDLFQARQETGVLDIAEKIGALYGQGGEARKRIDRIISERNMMDIFWVGTLTDAAKIRDVAQKAETYFKQELGLS